MIGRGHRRFVAETDDEFGPVLAELNRQFHPGFERIKQPAVGQMQQRANVDAERFAGSLSFGQPYIGPRRKRRRFAVGEVDDANLVAGVDQRGKRAAARDFDVVGMGANCDNVERLVCGRGRAHIYS